MGRVSHTAEKRSEDPNKRKPGDTFPAQITSLQVEVSKRPVGHGVIGSVFLGNDCGLRSQINCGDSEQTLQNQKDGARMEEEQGVSTLQSAFIFIFSSAFKQRYQASVFINQSSVNTCGVSK